MPERILIADDEVEMTSLLAFNFGCAGFAVSTARDGSEAFEKARMFLPDVIVLDVQMPGMGGLDLCRLLRSLPMTRHIPILIMTGRVDEQTRAASRKNGAVDFVSKPFSPRDLIERVRMALGRSFAE